MAKKLGVLIRTGKYMQETTQQRPIYYTQLVYCGISITYRVVALSANGCSLGDSWQETGEWPEDKVSPELNKSAGTVDM